MTFISRKFGKQSPVPVGAELGPVQSQLVFLFDQITIQNGMLVYSISKDKVVNIHTMIKFVFKPPLA